MRRLNDIALNTLFIFNACNSLNGTFQNNFSQTNCQLIKTKVLKEAGDDVNTCLERSSKQNRTSESNTENKTYSILLPCAEEVICFCQTWIALEENQTIQKTLFVNQKKLITSPIEFIFD